MSRDATSDIEIIGTGTEAGPGRQSSLRSLALLALVGLVGLIALSVVLPEDTAPETAPDAAPLTTLRSAATTSIEAPEDLGTDGQAADGLVFDADQRPLTIHGDFRSSVLESRQIYCERELENPALIYETLHEYNRCMTIETERLDTTCFLSAMSQFARPIRAILMTACGIEEPWDGPHL